MDEGASVTRWFKPLEQGDSAAASAIWKRFFPDLVRLARDKLRGVPRGMADEEDVALSAMNAFLEGARQGRFPDLADRHDLWRLLLWITARKAVDLGRHERRKRRGGGRVRGESALGPPDGQVLGQIIGRAPTPEFAATMAEQCRALLGLLDDNTLCELALRKLEGYSNAELAAQFDCSERTIERRLQLIREKWKEEREQ